VDVYSGLFISSLLPVKPRKLTKKEKEALSVPKELKEILIGLVLGDLNVQKQKNKPIGSQMMVIGQVMVYICVQILSQRKK
jgi:hypothetical protein